ncbi:MAG: IS110 family transposase, partial [Methylocella sp.]
MDKLRHPTNVTHSDEVEGKWFPYGVGIDCHKDMVWACVLRPVYDSGKQKRDLSKFSTSLAGLKEMREWLEERVPFDHRRVLVESTSTYHFPVLRALPKWRPTVINPMLVGSAKRKTDRWDAQTLAHHSMAGTFPEYVIPTLEELALRMAYRRWLKVGHSIVRATNALRSRMTMFGVNYDFSAGTNIGWQIMSSMCRGVPPARHLLRTPALWRVTEYDDLVKALPVAVAAVNSAQLDEVTYLRNERIEVMKSCLAAVPDGIIERLMTVPHIKAPAALCFTSEIGFDPRRRFSNVKAIVSFAGFDPSKRVSADSVTSHLPSAGSRFLKHSILQVAGGALMSRGTLATYGHAVAQRVGKRGWQAGRNAVGRKLVRWLAAVHFSRTPFMEGYAHGCKNAWGSIDDAVTGDPFGIDGGLPAAADWDGPGSASP